MGRTCCLQVWWVEWRNPGKKGRRSSRLRYGICSAVERHFGVTLSSLRYGSGTEATTSNTGQPESLEIAHATPQHFQPIRT